jgi:hypothetical protein
MRRRLATSVLIEELVDVGVGGCEGELDRRVEIECSSFFFQSAVDVFAERGSGGIDKPFVSSGVERVSST